MPGSYFLHGDMEDCVERDGYLSNYSSTLPKLETPRRVQNAFYLDTTFSGRDQGIPH